MNKPVKRKSGKVKKLVFAAICVLTAISLINMIYVRTASAGYALLTMDSDKGAALAAGYISCVVLFVIMLVVFIIAVRKMFFGRQKRKRGY